MKEEIQDKDEITTTGDAVMTGKVKNWKKKRDLMLKERGTESIEPAKEDYGRKPALLC